MIDIIDKKKCCGCTACQQVCQKQCIEMQEDSEGFLYPKVDVNRCTNCGLCEKVCPILYPFERTIEEPISYACKSKDSSLVEKSSSGGIFTILATNIIEDGGVVFGARFNDNWEIVHDFTETIEGLSAFRGSKYVQSKLGDSFSKVKEFLNSGRKVLFVGTPCQVSGLNHFLRKQYDNLYTFDIVCHSIASPKVWRLYLDEVKGSCKITNVSFRDKSMGWRSYGLHIQGRLLDSTVLTLDRGKHTENIFMRGFLENLTVRPSCTLCPARNYITQSDLMLADCWRLEKYHPDWDDNKGMSQVLILSDKGQQLFDSITEGVFIRRIPYNEVEEHGVHAPITSSTHAHPYRSYFFDHFSEVNSVKKLICRCLKRYDRKKACKKMCLKMFHSLPGFSILKSLKDKL